MSGVLQLRPPLSIVSARWDSHQRPGGYQRVEMVGQLLGQSQGLDEQADFDVALLGALPGNQ